MLTRQKSEASAKVIQLEQKLAAMEERLAKVSAPASGNSSGGSPPAPASGNPTDINAMIQQAVTQAIQGYTAETTKKVQMQQSFDAAARELPELLKGDSEAFKLFEHLWDSEPRFQEMPDGPLFVAARVKSMLGNSKQAPSLNRQFASSPLPLGARERLGSSSPVPDADAIVQKAAEKAATYGLEGDEMEALISAKNVQYDAKRQGR